MVEPVVTNAADREQLELADEEIDLESREFKNDLRQVLTTPQGRRVIFALLEDCHVFESVFSTDALVMSFKAGEQNIGQQWSAKVEQTKPGALFELMKAAAVDRAAIDRARKARRKQRSEEAATNG